MYCAQWPELFRSRRVLVRIDTGTGRGHHQHVRTAGTYSKFGVPLDELPELQQLAARHGVEVFGLHAHTGSGITDISNWTSTAEVLMEAGAQARDRHHAQPRWRLRRSRFHASAPPWTWRRWMRNCWSSRPAHPGIQLWLEPGRYLVAVGGVLLARVTQLKQKGAQGYIGVATGMNALIRPALYGAFHEIVNLSRLADEGTGSYDVVGPICESGDVLGHDRLLPDSQRRRRAAGRQHRRLRALDGVQLQPARAA